MAYRITVRIKNLDRPGQPPIEVTREADNFELTNDNVFDKFTRPALRIVGTWWNLRWWSGVEPETRARKEELDEEERGEWSPFSSTWDD